jgi:hypothetical protein
MMLGGRMMTFACELGKICFVQNYVDVDPGPAALDFTCGSATYDGHKGIDIRLSVQDGEVHSSSGSCSGHHQGYGRRSPRM